MQLDGWQDRPDLDGTTDTEHAGRSWRSMTVVIPDPGIGEDRLASRPDSVPRDSCQLGGWVSK